MSLKIAAAAESSPKSGIGAAPEKLVVVREYVEERDKLGVEEMEKMCEVGQRGKPSLVTDLLGDPACRIRHFPSHVMLVAEYGEGGGIVGVIRGCIKTVTTGISSFYVKLAYILGLRVSPTHRRLGIGAKLVFELEKWCKRNGAEYAYMATDCTNEASINLFTQKCSYTKFRNPTILVQPVHAHYKPIPTSITIFRIHPQSVESIYRQIFSNSEFFPEDIDNILYSALNLGTFMAVPNKSLHQWDPKNNVLPSSYAILSVWNTNEVFKLQVKGVSRLTYACCVGSRLFDEWMPWFGIPSIPDVFSQFGVYFVYGLHMEGECGSRLMRALCAFAHNMARDDDGCGAVVAEVSQRDPVREAIPHWRKFSWAEDIWCMKELKDEDQDVHGRFKPLDWTKRQSTTPVIFVDPRDF